MDRRDFLLAAAATAATPMAAHAFPVLDLPFIRSFVRPYGAERMEDTQFNEAQRSIRDGLVIRHYPIPRHFDLVPHSAPYGAGYDPVKGITGEDDKLKQPNGS